ncbi:hypothetical protein [Bacteroides fragilis]|uniref:hypothetical protein n=1 Tax=Bacteroides fragilis TaxID=817 RepID=UPI00202EE614|nr:hypothetical protein [Bacteroides fragilis]MCM0315579.1 hypothetical protein [Bacteroides fragilis]
MKPLNILLRTIIEKERTGNGKGIEGRRGIFGERKSYNKIMNLIFKRMGAVAKFLLNITLITVISVVLRIIVSYYPDYDARDFDTKIFPYIITGLFFLAAFLNPEGSLCRKGDVIIGIIALVLSIIISFIAYELEHMSWH